MIRNIVRGGCITLMCVLLLLASAAGLAEPAVMLEAEMGYEGNVTYIRTMPIFVTLTNNGSDLSGVLSLNVNRDDIYYDRYEMPLSVAAGSTVRVALPVVLTQRQRAYTVRFEVDGQVVVERDLKPGRIIDPTSLIVGALGKDSRSFAYMDIDSSTDPLARSEMWTTVPLTADAFPTDVESLRFFDMLAVDGFDMTLLTDAQKKAFDQWLSGGGVVLVGGGARAGETFPFFQPYTGISAGAVQNDTTLTAQLLEVFGLKGTPLTQPVTTVALNGASGQSVGTERLVDVTRVGDGYLFTAAFSLTEQPLDQWLGQNVIWQRMLLANAQTRYRAMVEQRVNYTYSQNSVYVDTGVTSTLRVANSGTMALPMVLIALFVVLVGFGGYFLLKRFDKRDWMWLTVPVLAVVTSLGIWGLSAVLPLKEPIAVHYTVVTVDEDGSSDSYAAVTAAKADQAALTMGADEGVIDLGSTISYYVNSDPSTEEQLSKLRYICTYGEQTTITLPASEVWQQYSMLVRDVPTQDMSAVSGSCSWDGDSLVMTVTNGSDIPLEGGVVFTDFGFASVDELLPGQTATVRLSPLPDNKTYTRDELLRDGALLTKQDLQNYSFYDFISAFSGQDVKRQDTEQKKERAIIRRALLQAAGLDRQREKALFAYVGFSDKLDDLRLRLDGKYSDRTAQYGIVLVQLSYDPVSSDGSVRFLDGSFPVHLAQVAPDGTPTLGERLISTRYRSYMLSTSPAFAYDVSAVPAGMELTAMDVSGQYNYYSHKVMVYNAQKSDWQEFKRFTMDRNTGIGKSQYSLPDLKDCIMDGYLYVRFEKGTAAEDYAEIYSPVLTMDGRLR